MAKWVGVMSVMKMRGKNRSTQRKTEKPKYSEENLSHYQFVYHKTHMDWSVFEFEILLSESDD
jgi:hypothetical protein